MPRLVVPVGTKALRVDKFLAASRVGTRAEVQRWIEGKRVLVDGGGCQPKTLVRSGQVVEYDPAPPLPSEAVPDPTVHVSCVFEDEHLIVVDKPAGLVVHPAKGHWSGTLINGLLALPTFERTIDPLDPAGALRPGLVHRIDKDTSGLLVVAKSAPAREGLKEQFSSRQVQRSYLALTSGVPSTARIETWHGRHPVDRLRFTSRGSSGKRAVTHVTLIESFGAHSALVRCKLETGRTHQIRVHLAEQCGTPLLGDVLYGYKPSSSLSAFIVLERQALHAAELGFQHPITGRSHAFVSPLPSDMSDTLAALRQAEASGALLR